MNVKKVTLAELIDVTNKHWGYAEDEIDGAHIATVLHILLDGSMTSTGNIQSFPVMSIWNPFCNHIRKTKKNKLVGYFTLKEKDLKEVVSLKYLEYDPDKYLKAYKRSKNRKTYKA